MTEFMDWSRERSTDSLLVVWRSCSMSWVWSMFMEYSERMSMGAPRPMSSAKSTSGAEYGSA